MKRQEDEMESEKLVYVKIRCAENGYIVTETTEINDDWIEKRHIFMGLDAAMRCAEEILRRWTGEA